MKGRRFLALLCAIMIFMMNFSGIPAMADNEESGASETVVVEKTKEEPKKEAPKEESKKEESKKEESKEEPKKEAPKEESKKEAPKEESKKEESKEEPKKEESKEESKKEESKEESKQEESKEESKKEESKEEPKQEESKEESKKDEPAEESKADESKEESGDETKEEPREDADADPTQAPETQGEVVEQPEVTEAPTEEPTEEPKEPLTLSGLRASAQEVFPGEKITFTFETTGAERVEFGVYRDGKLVEDGALEGGSFSWTPDAPGSYIVAVTAFQGGDSVMDNVSVNVRPDYSDVKVTFTAKDEDGNTLGGYSKEPFSRGDYALAGNAPVSVADYAYQEARLGDRKIVRLWYESADRVWYYTEEYIENGKTKYADAPITEDADLVLRFTHVLTDVTVTFTAVDAEGNGVGGQVDVALVPGSYNLKAEGPQAVESEKNYKYVKTTLNDRAVDALAYDAERGWQITLGGETSRLESDIALTVHYREVFAERVYEYDDSSIHAVITLARANAVPDDAELVVTPITGGGSYDAYMQALNNHDDQEYSGENTLLYDFAFMAQELDPETGLPTGKTVEVKPERNTMRVNVTFKKNQISKVAGEEATAEDVTVLHLPLKDSVLDRVDATVDADISASDIKRVEELGGNVNLDGGADTVDFKATSFSVFAFTVDFHYEGVDYSIPGMSQILLSELIQKLHIMNGDSPLDVKDVAEVEFTDERLVTVEQVSGIITYNNVENVDVGEKDFLLTSKQPFTSNEVLTITLIDGTVIEVGVTDAQSALEAVASSVKATVDSSTTVTDVARNGTVTVKIEYNIDDSKLDTAKANTPWVYDLSDFVATYPMLSVANLSGGSIMDGATKAGTYSIEDNKVTLDVDSTWLNSQTKKVKGSFTLNVVFDSEQVKTEQSHEFSFPGTTDPLTVKFKDVKFEHSKTVEGNNNNVVTVTQDENGDYRLHYKLWVKSDSYMDSLVLSDTMSGSQKLDPSTIKVTDGTWPNPVYTDKLGLTSTDTTFSFDLVKALKDNGAAFAPGTGYTVEYDAIIPADKVGAVDKDGKPVSGSSEETNSATWTVDGTPQTPDETKVTTKAKKVVEKNVEQSKNAEGKTVLTYTITLGDASTDFAGHTISDNMINLQDLNETSIDIKDGTGAVVATLTRGNGIVWTQPETHNANGVDVFSYTFPNDKEVMGPLTITYSTTVVDSADGITGKRDVSNTVTDQYPDDGEKVSGSAGISGVDFGEESAPATITKTGRIDTDNLDAQMIYWTIVVTPDANATLPLKNVDIIDYYAQYGFAYDYYINKDLEFRGYTLYDGVGNTGKKLSEGTDYEIIKGNVYDWGTQPYSSDREYKYRVFEMNGPVTVEVATYVPDGFTNEANEIFYAKNSAKVVVDGKEDSDTALVSYRSTDHTFTKTGSYDKANDVFNWTVVINASKNTVDPDYAPGFKDIIPDGMEFVTYHQTEGSWDISDEDSAANIYVQTEGTVGSGYFVRVSVDGQTISADDLTKAVTRYGSTPNSPAGLSGTSYTISYKTRLTDEEKSRTSGSSTTNHYTNTAYEIKDGTEVKSATTTIDYTYTAITKEDLSDRDLPEDIIIYKVVANPEAIALHNGAPMTVSDFIPTNVELVTNTVSLVIEDAKGNDVTADSTYKVGYNDDTRLLTITIPDERTVTITFEVRVKELTNGAAVSYGNTVVLRGSDTHEATTTKDHVVSKHSSDISGMHEGTINLLKIDEYSLSKTLGGAVFELYELQVGDDYKINGSGTLVNTFETESDGKVVFMAGEDDGLKYETLYYWIETKAPEGYKLPATNQKHYFIMYARGNSDQKQRVWDMDDAIQDANGITVKSIEEYDSWTATNVQDTDYTVPLFAIKRLSGKTLEDGEFTFTVTPDAQNDDDLVDASGLTTSVTNQGEAVDFGSVSFTGAGTFVYAVRETAGDNEGMTYDDTVFTITVVTSYNNDGELVGETTITNGTDSVEEMIFNNEYTATGSVQLTAKKTLKGATLEENQFSFQLKDADGKVLDTKSNAVDGSVTFDAIEYTLVDVKKSPITYTISEVIPDEADRNPYINYSDETVTVTVTLEDDGEGHITATPDKPGAEVSFTNVATGDLEVTKTVAGNAPISGAEFSFTVTLTGSPALTGEYGDMTFKNNVATFVLKDGETKTATKLPAGYGYTVTETDYSGSGYVTTKTGETGTIVAEKTQTAAFINTRNSSGSLSITKKTEGNATEADDTFYFVVEITGPEAVLNNSDVMNGTYSEVKFTEGKSAVIALENGETKIIEGLPNGTAYTVTEVEKDGTALEGGKTASGYTADKTSENGTISETAAQAHTFTNTKNTYADLTISKTVKGNAAKADEKFTFTINLTGRDDKPISDTYTAEGKETSVTFVNGSYTVELKGGESLTIKKLPNGATYTVTEDRGDYTATVVSKHGSEAETDPATTATASATITGGDGVTYEEKFTNEKNSYGELKVQKKLTGNAATLDASLDKEFKIRVTLYKDANKTQVYTDVNGEHGAANFTKGVAEFTIKASDIQKILTNLPNGAFYVVEEIDGEGKAYTPAPTITGGTGTITGGDNGKGDKAPVAVVTNKVDEYGGLKLTKQVENGTTEDEFTFNVYLYPTAENWKYKNDENVFPQVTDAPSQSDPAVRNATAYKATVELKSGQSVEFTDIDVGTTYYIEETGADNYVVKYSGQKGTIVATTDGTAAVKNQEVVTNTKKTGSLMVTKKVTGNLKDTATDTAFPITVNFTPAVSGAKWSIVGMEGETTFSGASVTIPLKGDQTAVIEGIDAGTVYTVEETLTDEQKERYATPEYTYPEEGETHTIEAGDTKTVTVTNTIDGYGGLKIVKVTEGNDADKKSWFGVKIELSDKTFNGVVKAHDSRGDFEIPFVNGVSAPSRIGEAVKNVRVTDVNDARYWMPDPTAALPDGYIAIRSTTADRDYDALELSGLPAGVTYTVTEDDYSKTYDKQEIVYSDEDKIIEADAVDEVTITNTRDRWGKLAIQKIIVGNDISVTDEFTFKIELEDAAGNPVSGTFSDITFDEKGEATVKLSGNTGSSRGDLQAYKPGDNGGSLITIEGLPLGTKFTVTETDKKGYTDAYDLLYRVSVDGATDEEKEALDLYNQEIERYNEEIRRYNEEQDDDSKKKKEKEEETKASHKGSGENSGTIDVDQRVVVVTNTRNTYGNLEITKTVDGNAGNKTKAFTFTVKLTGNSDEVKTGEYEVETEGTVVSGTKTEDGKKYVDFGESRTATLEVELADGQKLTVKGLPNGTAYEVVETNYKGAGYTTDVVGSGTVDADALKASGTIVGNKTETADYTNTRNAKGSLVLSKALAGNDPETEVDAFELALDTEPKISGVYDAMGLPSGDKVTFTAGHATVKIVPGTDVTIDGLPNGTEVTVSEIGGTPANHTKTTYVPADGKVTIDEAESVKVTVTNTRDTFGQLTLSKQVTGEDANLDRLFRFTVTLKDANDEPLSGKFEVTATGDVQNLTEEDGKRYLTFAENGVAVVRMKHNESLTVNGLPNGAKYTVEETNAPGYAATVNGTAGRSAEGTITGEQESKAEYVNDYTAPDKPNLEKKIKDVNDSTGEASRWQDSADYDIGDEVLYQLTATLASNVSDYKAYHITFHDAMDDGLTFKEITSVKVGDTEIEEGGYKLDSGVHDFDLTLTWDEADISAALNQAKVVVEFTAELNGDAVLGKQGNINTAYLTYSNNPNLDQAGKPIEDEGKTDEDTVICFTYQLPISKVDEDGTTPLPGAKFLLEKQVDGSWKTVSEQEADAKDGNVFTFKGLDDGKYRLTETKVPAAGYKFMEPIEFTVTATHEGEWDVKGAAAATDTKRADALASLTGDKSTGAVALGTIQADGTFDNSVKNEKAEEPTLEKKIEDVNDTTGDTAWGDSADHDINDPVNFKLTATLADNVTDYETYRITFRDEMEKGLTFDKDSVKVTVNGNAFSATPTTTDDGFDLTLEWNGKDGEKIADTSLNKAEVVVLFAATLNEDAKIGSEGNVNKAKLYYTNNPSVVTEKSGTPDDDENTGDTEWDGVIAFTYQLAVNKVDKDSKPLTGAEFKLEKVLPGGAKKLIATVQNTEGNTFTFKGLDDGKYVLTETKVPAGYKFMEPIEFTVTANHKADEAWELDGETPLIELKADETEGVLSTGEINLADHEGNKLVNEEATKPTLEKKIEDKNDTTGESGWGDSADHDINDPVNFKLTATLADNVTDYETYRITFRDEMEMGLTFDKDSVKVTVNGEAFSATPTETETGFDLTLTWKGEGGKKIADTDLNKAEVVVLFTATLNENAEVGNIGNVNKAKLYYTNNPSVEDDGKAGTPEGKKPENPENPDDNDDTGETDWDAVIAFTYQVEIDKVAEDGTTKLPNALFELKKQLKDGSLADVALDAANTSGSKFTFKGLDDGTYVLTETQAPKGYKLMDPITFKVEAKHDIEWTTQERAKVLTDLTGDKVTGEITLTRDGTLSTLAASVKNTPAEEPKLEKKIKETDETADTVSDWQDAADYDVDKPIPFKLTATLADNVTDYYQYHITFHDTMDEGLSFIRITSVKLNGKTLAATEYTRKELSDQEFDLTLTWGDGETRISDAKLNGAKVEVEYTAKLNGNAVKGSAGNVNRATLEYSNNPMLVDDGKGGKTPSDETKETPEDAVIAFTYLVEVTKVDEKGAARRGAAFKLEKVNAAGTKVVGTYTAETAGNVFTFDGLDSGKYVLTETRTPDGYAAIDPITFTVTAKYDVEWEDLDAPGKVLKSLTATEAKGDKATGLLTLTCDKDTGVVASPVVNEKLHLGDLKVTKTVKNAPAAQTGKSFHFTVTLTDKTIAGAYGDMTFTKGVAQFYLKNGESKTATGLPAKVGYTVTEDKYENYTTKSSGAKGTIAEDKTVTAEFTNTYVAPTTTTPGGGGTYPNPTPRPRIDIEGTKVWKDENNAHKTRPSDIEIELLADGSPVDATPTWTKSGNVWSYSFKNVPEVTEAGITIHYTVREVPVQYYQASISGFSITNELIPRQPDDYVELSGVKTWADNDNADGQRPTFIQVHLLRDGQTIETLTVTAATDWSYDFGRLPADDGYGNRYTYTIREDAVEGYYTRINGMNLTNGRLTTVVPNKPPKKNAYKPGPDFEGMTDEELEELFDLFGYGTPLFGMLGTGDETPVYPFVFGGIGLLAVALLILGRKRRES